MEHLNNLEIEYIPTEIGNTRADLCFTFDMDKQNLALCMEYNDNLYSREVIANILGSIKNIVFTLFLDSEENIMEYPILTDVEMQNVLSVSNQSSESYNRANQSIYLQFHEIATAHKMKPAIIDGDEILTYEELNDVVNQICVNLISDIIVD